MIENKISQEEIELFKKIREAGDTLNKHDGIFLHGIHTTNRYFRVEPQHIKEVGVTGLENLIMPIDLVEHMYKKNKTVVDTLNKFETILGKLSIIAHVQHKDKKTTFDIMELLHNHQIEEHASVIERETKISQPPISLQLELYSSDKSIETISNINKRVQDFKTQPRGITKRKIELLFGKYKPIYSRYGDIRHLDVESCTQEINDIKTFAVQIGNDDYYVFAGKEEPIIAHMGTPKEHRTYIYNQNQVKKLITKLIENDYLVVNKQVGEEKLIQIENEMILKNKPNLKSIRPEFKKVYNAIKHKKYVGPLDRMRFIERHYMKHLQNNKEWSNMKKILYDPKHFSYLPPSTQLRYLKNNTDSPYVDTVIQWAKESLLKGVMKKAEPGQHYEGYVAVDWSEENSESYKAQEDYWRKLEKLVNMQKGGQSGVL